LLIHEGQLVILVVHFDTKTADVIAKMRACVGRQEFRRLDCNWFDGGVVG
jgi:hypothetical protein